MIDRLKVVSVDSQSAQNVTSTTRPLSRRQEIQAKFDRLWLTEPEQFNPLRNCMERLRLKRTLQLIEQQTQLTEKLVVDLGCGSGVFARHLRDKNAHIEAVDISINALKVLKSEDCQRITALQDFVPHTKLIDNHYDLVVSLELIGYIPSNEQRLYMSELSRLVKSDGFVICSTALDIDTQDPVQAFGALAETEFSSLIWKFSYHALYLRIIDFLRAPERFFQGWKNHSYRKEQIGKRYGFGKWWYSMNSSVALGWFWAAARYLANPMVKLLQNNETILLGVEKICRFFWSEAGISHAIFIGKRRPLVMPTPEELLAIEPKHKRQVWE